MNSSLQPRLVKPMAIRQKAVQQQKEEAKPRTRAKPQPAPPEKLVYALVSADGKEMLATGIRAEMLMHIRDNPNSTYDDLYVATGAQENRLREYATLLVKHKLLVRAKEPRGGKAGGYIVAKYSLADNVVVGNPLGLIGK